MASTALQGIAQEGKAVGSEIEDSTLPSSPSMKEEFPGKSQSYHGLPLWSVEQSNDQPIESRLDPDSRNDTTLPASDDDLVIISETSCQKSRRRALTDKEIPSQSSKRLRSERQRMASEETSAQKINFYKASIQRKEQSKAEKVSLEWRPVEESAARKLFSEVQIRRRAQQDSLFTAQRLHHDEKHIQISVSEAAQTIRRLLGKDSIAQVRALLEESRHPQCCVRWSEIMIRRFRGNITQLMACCNQFAQSNSAFDFFGENLAKSELHRAWTSETVSKTDVATSEKDKNERALAVRDGGKLRLLADAFGIGILALIPRHPDSP